MSGQKMKALKSFAFERSGSIRMIAKGETFFTDAGHAAALQRNRIAAPVNTPGVAPAEQQTAGPSETPTGPQGEQQQTIQPQDQQQPEAIQRKDYSGLNFLDLKAEARAAKIEGYTKMDKEALIEALNTKGDEQ